MGKISSLAPTKRRLIQLYTALLYNANISGFASGKIFTGASKYVCVPGLNCYSCPGAIGACPLGSLQNAIAGANARLPYYIIGILLLFSLFLGRLICGFLCPVGLFQELLYKIPSPKLKKNRITYMLSYLKYMVLAVFVIGIPLISVFDGIPIPAFCKYICPAGTLGGAVPLLINPNNGGLASLTGALFTNKLVILCVIAVVSIFIFRCFCRFLCPLGAIYSLFNKIALFGIKFDEEKCVNCGKCVRECKMDIKKVGDRECVNCGECISSCPTQAISWKCLKYKSRNNAPLNAAKAQTRRIAALAAALILLVCTLWYANFYHQSGETASVKTAQALGAVGTESADITLSMLNGGDFILSEHRGKTIVINFWATWCAPCLKELVHFERLYNEHKREGDVVVVAVHSQLINDDIGAFINSSGYTFPIAVDTDGAVIAAFGGFQTLPVTVIINKDGVITYSQAGAVTYEFLESKLDK